MKAKKSSWAAIAQSPKFIELHRRKTKFLLGLWIFGAVSYFLLPLGAAYTPGLFSMKIAGRMNFAYIFCLYQFILTWGIALYYTYKTNKDFDPLTQELIDQIERGEL